MQLKTADKSVKKKDEWMDSFTERYTDLIKVYVTSKHVNDLPLLNELVADFLEIDCSPRDIINIHLKAVDQLCHNLTPNGAKKLTTETRFLVLDVMIHLVDLFRQRWELMADEALRSKKQKKTIQPVRGKSLTGQGGLL